MVACGRDLERRLADINQKVVEAERKLREAESSSPDMSSSEKVCLPVNCTGRCVSPSLASHTVSLHKGVLLIALKHLVPAAGIRRAGHAREISPRARG